jgi:hypothetical protein
MAALLSHSERIERLRSQLQGRPAGRAGLRAKAGGDSALLYGVLLRAAARHEAGLELTPLEAGLLGPLGYLLSPQEIGEVGCVYAEEAAAGRAQGVLPGALAARPLEQGYAADDLFAALAAMDDPRGQPNVQVVDAATTTGEMDGEGFARASREAGFGVTMVTSSEAAALTDTAAPYHARIVADHFYCKDDTGEDTKDEIYWALAAGADGGDQKSTRTKEYGSGKADTTWTFADGTVLFDGMLSKTLSCHIACWEADQSDDEFYEEMERKLRIISEELWKFGEAIEDYPVGQWENTADWIKFGSLIARLIAELVEFFRNEDDLVQERTLVFDRAALVTLANRPGQTDWWLFAGAGGGKFHLHLKWAGRGDTRLLSTTTANGSSWSTDTPFPAGFPSGATLDAPALAAYDNKLFCMVRSGSSGEDLRWASFNGTAWSAFSPLGEAKSPSSPALAVHNGKLYSLHRSQAGQLYWASFDGARWSGYALVPGNQRTFTAPALASYNGRLYCMVRGSNLFFPTYDLYWASFDGATWSGFTQLPGKSPSAPALAAFNNKLFAVHRGIDDALYWTVLNGTTWGEYQQLPSGKTSAAPALAVHGADLYCAVRGAGETEGLFWTIPSGSTWKTFTRIDASSTAAPALASYNGKLYCVHRG